MYETYLTDLSLYHQLKKVWPGNRNRFVQTIITSISHTKIHF